MMNTPTDHQLFDLLAREWAGELSPVESAGLARLLADRPESAARAQALRKLWDTTYPRYTGNANAAISALQKRARQSSSQDRSVRGYWRTSRTMIVGASLAVAAFVVPLVVWDRHDPAQPSAEFATAPGERRTVTLQDGTTLILAPATHLTVTGRTVRLTGAAQFTVTSYHDTPFTVHTAGATTRVLGTMFSVRQYESDDDVRVAVASGKVAVAQRVPEGEMGSAHAVLTERTMAVVRDSGEIVVIPNIAIADEFGWTQGRLVFRDTPFQAAVTEIERMYGVRIHIADSSLASLPVTATFDGESLQSIIDLLGFSINASVTISGQLQDTITFTPARNTRARPRPLAAPSQREPAHG